MAGGWQGIRRARENQACLLACARLREDARREPPDRLHTDDQTSVSSAFFASSSVTELGSLGVRDSYLNRKLRIAEESGGGFELGTHKRCRPLCYGTSPSLPSGHFCLFIVLSFIHPDCSSFSLRDRDTAPKAHTMNFHWVGLVIKGRFRYCHSPPRLLPPFGI